MFDGRGMPIPAFGLLFVLGCLVAVVGIAFSVGWYARGMRDSHATKFQLPAEKPLSPGVAIHDGTNWIIITNIVRVESYHTNISYLPQ